MRNNGFTLIEILVAAAIASILMLSVYGVFTQVATAERRLAAEAAAAHQARIIFDRMGRELRSFHAPGGGLTNQFSGGKTGEQLPFIDFSTTATTPQGGAYGTFSAVRYELRKSAGHKGNFELMRTERPLFLTENSQPRALKFGSDIKSMQLRFFDEIAGTWVEQWEPGQAKPPKMVEMLLTLSAGEKEVPFQTTFEVTRVSN